MRHLDIETATRGLVGSWLSRSVLEGPTGSDWGTGLDWELGLDWETGPDLGSGLAVPPAPARDVIAAACRVAIEGRKAGPQSVPSLALRRIAEAMVLDEHPSASDWTAAERRDALHWITLIIHRFGEDGLQRLVTELNDWR